MLKTETIDINGVNFTHNYSDAGMYIERDGIKYQDALDIPELNRTYKETNEKIPVLTAEQAQ